MYVAKVDIDVVYVAMAILACCKSMFEVFHVFEAYVVSVSSGYTYVAMVIYTCFKRMFQVLERYSCKCMLQMF
jgi:hypothetical protein